MKIDINAELDLDELAFDLRYETIPIKTLTNFVLDILSENVDARKKVHKALHQEFVVEPAMEKKLATRQKEDRQ